MAIEDALPGAAARNSKLNDKAALIAGAEKEMGAFLCAVERRRGPEIARRAASYWMEAFDTTSWPSGQTASIWRRITIAAASRLARETFPARLTTQQS